MKAPDFEYVCPKTWDALFAVLAEHGDSAKLLAGGQSLMAALNMRLSAPSILVDLAALPDLRGIDLDGDFLRIGAMTRHVDVLNSPEVRRHLPLVAEAMSHVAHPAVRNRGTHGGSLCFADPAAEMPACALALGAEFVIANATGQRTFAAADFFHDLFETALGPADVLLAVRYPIAKPNQMISFHEFTRRHGDYAMAGLATVATRAGNRLASLDLVFFGVSTKPVAAHSTAALLVANGLSDETIARGCAQLATDIEPFGSRSGSAEYKAHLMQVLLRRAMATFAAQEIGPA
jgi:aerobic carbon-monoxide dehydrogenase medium subunit